MEKHKTCGLLTDAVVGVDLQVLLDVHVAHSGRVPLRSATSLRGWGVRKGGKAEEERRGE